MSLPPAFLDEIRARVPLSRVVGRRVTWDLRKSNQARGDWWAPCPFHQEKTPSFHVDDQKGFYHCFGCQASGDAIKFLREAEGMEFLEAVRVLAAEAGLALPKRSPEARAETDRRTRLAEVIEQAVRWFRLQLQTAAAGAARDYLAGRGLDAAALERFEIGFAPDARTALTQALHGRGVAADLLAEAGLAIAPDDGGAPFDRFRGRIMFPIRDSRGRAVAFGGRAMDPGARAKYLNSPATPLFDKGRTLYNIGPARAAVGKGAALIVAEGYMDVIALVRAGFEGAVAPLGTAITEDQLRLLWRVAPEPVVALDGDAAGLRAATRLVGLALPLTGPGQALRFALLPPGLDPDDLIRGQGRGAMAAVLDQARPLVDLLWQRETEGRVFDSPERRAALDHALRAAIAQIPDPATRAHTEAEIRTRRAELFGGAGPGAGRRWSRRGAPGQAAPDAPRVQTRASRLVAADEGGRLLEGAVLSICARHPDLVAGVEARLEHLVPSDPGRAALLHDLLAGTASPEGRAALDALGLDPHLRLALMLGGGDPDRAALDLMNYLDRLEAWRAQASETARAEAEIGGDADEGLTWRVAQLARAREAAARPPIADLGDLGEDEASLAAELDAVLAAATSGGLSRRGRP